MLGGLDYRSIAAHVFRALSNLGVTLGSLNVSGEVSLEHAIIPGGRLTLTTAVPVTTADVSGAATVYYTPHKTNTLQLHDGDKWITHVFTELSQTTADNTKSPAAVANNSNYDKFVWNDSGTLRCTRGPAWSSDTARGVGAGTTELEHFEGRLVNKVAITNGPAARRGLFVGTIRSDGIAQINDTLAKRHVWNYYNRAVRPMRVLEATDSWTYTTATIRQANGATANQLDMVIGVSEDIVSADIGVAVDNATANATVIVGVGLDLTTAFTSGGLFPVQSATTTAQQLRANWRGFPGIGRHFLSWNEYSSATGTTTWYGDNANAALFQSGFYGELLG